MFLLRLVCFSVERYDPSKDAWEMVAPMADKRINFGVGVMLGFIFVVGGHNGVSHLSSIERYDPHQNQWTACRPMNEPRTGKFLINDFLGGASIQCCSADLMHHSSCRCWFCHCGQLPLCSRRALRVILPEHCPALRPHLRQLVGLQRHDVLPLQFWSDCPLTNGPFS